MCIAPPCRSMEEEEPEHRRFCHAITTACCMLHDRGFVITKVGGKPVETPRDAALPWKDSAYCGQVAAGVDACAGTVAAYAELTGGPTPFARVVEATVPCKPRRYTTAWAAGFPPGALASVVLLTSKYTDEVKDAFVAEVMDMRPVTCVFVGLHSLTVTSRKLYIRPEAGVQYFTFDLLRRPVGHHHSVPPYMPLDAKGVQVVRARHGAARHACLKLSDPQAQYYGLRPGMMVSTVFVSGQTPVDSKLYVVRPDKAVPVKLSLLQDDDALDAALAASSIGPILLAHKPYMTGRKKEREDLALWAQMTAPLSADMFAARSPA